MNSNTVPPEVSISFSLLTSIELEFEEAREVVELDLSMGEIEAFSLSFFPERLKNEDTEGLRFKEFERRGRIVVVIRGCKVLKGICLASGEI